MIIPITESSWPGSAQLVRAWRSNAGDGVTRNVILGPVTALAVARDVWDWELGLASGFWSWLHETSPGQATFLGSVFGFVALLCGAWANAGFNRRRDDRLRREDQRAVATALRAELEGLRRALTNQAESLKKELGPDEGHQTSDLSQLVRIMPEMVPKFGLLDQETTQSVMNAYAMLEAYYMLLLTLGGDPLPQFSPQRVLFLSSKQVPVVQKLNADQSKTVQEAIAKLDAFLART